MKNIIFFASLLFAITGTTKENLVLFCFDEKNQTITNTDFADRIMIKEGKIYVYSYEDQESDNLSLKQIVLENCSIDYIKDK